MIYPEITIGFIKIRLLYSDGQCKAFEAVLVYDTRSRIQYSVTGKGFMAVLKMDMIKLQALLKKHNDSLQKEKEKNNRGKMTVVIKVDFAGHNSPSMCNISGNKDALAFLQRKCDQEKVLCRKISFKEDMHSYQTDQINVDILSSLKRITS
ncbi:MAG: hypothetical protein EZS28_015274 [Streblomastix strix]|uniref:Malonyl-CoA:ACP transacylase (MAT) domain-containing protein n=1 Tax=Streblomastix strix TaxID=222440 RepID=A0A5J4W3B6_9EUKA|nr:MAG: hypothetical protein EZS28_015274 [Streblomastix strix]